MAVVENNSVFPAEMVVAQDATAAIYLVLAVRATFDIAPDNRVVAAAEQDPVCTGDEYYGEPAKSSLKNASDMALAKPATDVAVLGSARAPRGEPVTRMDVVLSVGPVLHRVVVFGDRRWQTLLGIAGISRPEPFVEMPIVYERAFGGTDDSHENPRKHAWDPRNPVGTGFRVHRPLDGMPLPNIEDPAALISSRLSRPAPQGFGFIPGHWAPRSSFVGTYDERWQREQCPLLPEDFDPRYYQAAHPALICDRHLAGDEAVRIIGMSEEGELAFDLPGVGVGVTVHPRHGRPSRHVAALDTIILRPNERKLNLVWRCTIRCPRKVFDVESVVTFSARLRALREMERLDHEPV